MALAPVVLAVRTVHLAAVVAMAEGAEAPMTLHERIAAAVEKRLAVAQAADGALSDPGTTMDLPPVGPWADFEADNDPARIIRDCRRDLKVLERHRPTADIEGRGPFYNCRWCSAPVPRHCAEIRDLAEAYEIGVDDAK